MDFLKFNCHDMAAQNIELQGVYSKTRGLAEELEGVLNTLDPQIKSYESLQNQFAAVNKAVADSAVRVLAAYNALDNIIDLYYAAENRALQASEELPAGIIVEGKRRGVNAPDISKVSASSINREDLVLENWLAELVYKYDRNGNDE